MTQLIVRAALVAVWGLASIACRTVESAPPGPPDFVILNPQIWRGRDLRLVGPNLGVTPDVTVLFDDSLAVDTALLRFAAPDTIVATIELPGGPHTVSLTVQGKPSATRAFEVGGMDGPLWVGDWPETAPLTYVMPRPIGSGSPQLWVGTSYGLALLDARYPAQRPALVDSTVEPTCLRDIGASVSGAVVTADRGCGTLRARMYSLGSAPVEVDSGPRAARLNGGTYERLVRHALNHPPGVWLLDKYDSVVLAVRDTNGGWQWSAWQAEVIDLVMSPTGAIGLAEALASRRYGHAILVFDLEQGRLLYQDTTVGPAATFTPSGDTIVALASYGDSVVLLDAPTGARLASIAVASPSPRPFANATQLVWDPLRPWLIGFLGDYVCDAQYTVVDRRTWSVARPSQGGDCGAWDGVIAVSRADPVGWILTPTDATAAPFKIGRFYIPGP